MPFAYYDRLSPARQRIYRTSDAIEALDLPGGSTSARGSRCPRRSRRATTPLPCARPART